MPTPPNSRLLCNFHAIYRGYLLDLLCEFWILVPMNRMGIVFDLTAFCEIKPY